MPGRARYVDYAALRGPRIRGEHGREIHETGRLGPGEYAMSAYSVLFTDTETADGAVYAVLWTCVPVPAAGSACSRATSRSRCGAPRRSRSRRPVRPQGYGHQWRRNFVPITNDGHFSGATSRALVIQNACDADAGTYDVVLSDGTVVDRAARRRSPSSTHRPGRDRRGRAAPVLDRSLRAQSVRDEDLVRYAAARPQRARIMIYNAAGALVRTLVDGVVSGSGTLTWDGATTGGSRAPAGIYFLRVETETARESRKIVLLR